MASRRAAFAVGLVGSSVPLVYYLSDSTSGVYKAAMDLGRHVTGTDAEFAHEVAVKLAKHSLVPMDRVGNPPALRTTVWGITFPNVLGLAAGFDKNAECMHVMCGDTGGLGFGFVEVGSVTPQPQPGNPKPRVFRLAKDFGVINRYGFNSDGETAVAARLDAYRRAQAALPPTARGLVGVNLGKNKDTVEALDDYVRGVRALTQYADYMVVRRVARLEMRLAVLRGLTSRHTNPLVSSGTSCGPPGRDSFYLSPRALAHRPLDTQPRNPMQVNVSSPNTAGLRSLQGKRQLHALLDGVQQEMRRVVASPTYVSRSARGDSDPRYVPPLLVKISPDMSDSELSDVAAVAAQLRVDGIIVSNTTIGGRDALLERAVANEVGGLSGRPLKEKADAALGKLYRLTGGKIPLVGVGGVSSAEDAYDKIKLGASLVQVYSALVYEGPGLPAAIKVRYPTTSRIPRPPHKTRAHFLLSCPSFPLPPPHLPRRIAGASGTSRSSWHGTVTRLWLMPSARRTGPSGKTEFALVVSFYGIYMSLS